MRAHALQALEHAWIKDEGVARELPLEGTVVQVSCHAGELSCR